MTPSRATALSNAVVPISGPGEVTADYTHTYPGPDGYQREGPLHTTLHTEFTPAQIQPGEPFVFEIRWSAQYDWTDSYYDCHPDLGTGDISYGDLPLGAVNPGEDLITEHQTASGWVASNPYTEHQSTSVTCSGQHSGRQLTTSSYTVSVPAGHSLGQGCFQFTGWNTQGLFPGESSAGTLATLTVGPAGCVAPPQEDVLMVSVGDSVASGEGSPEFRCTEHKKIDIPRFFDIKIPVCANDPVWPNAQCHRTPKAGPALAATALEAADPNSDVAFYHLACSGARITNPEPGGAGGLLQPFAGIEAGPLLPPQLEQITQLGLNPAEIDVLTISIGANDLRFSDILKQCAYRSRFLAQHHSQCKDWKPGRTFREKSKDLTAHFDQLGQRLSSMGVRPSSVYITEYMDPLHDDDRDLCSSIVAHSIVKKDVKWADQEVLPFLNGAVKNAAQKYGWNYVGGIASAFANGHGECAKRHWIVQPEESFNWQGDQFGIAHPNEIGQRCYGTRLAAVLVQDLYGASLPGGPQCKDI